MSAQPALFPPRVPAPAAAIDVHAISLPARTFTGDFWFTHRASDRLWFALGDVAGKGLPAALVMAMIQEELEQRVASCARTACDPAATVQQLHAFLRPLLPRNRFATAVVGWLRDDGTTRLVNAGHVPPLIVRATGSVEPLGSTGPIIGVLPQSAWRASTHHLEPGDLLVLYSDGVSESASHDGREFGTEGIMHALPQRIGCTKEVARAILNAVQQHANGAREDDTTLLVISRNR